MIWTFCREGKRQPLSQISLLSFSSNARGSDCHWILVPSTGQIKNRRGCRGPQHGVLWQDCLVEIDRLSPLQKREHSQGPLPNPSRCSRPRLPSLAPSPHTLLFICGIRWLCVGTFNPQQENRRHSETSLAFQTGFRRSSKHRSLYSSIVAVQTKYQTWFIVYWTSCRQRPPLWRQARKSSRRSTGLISHT